MAGIGVKLTNIYKKNTLTTDIIGAGYSMVVTIAPHAAGDRCAYDHGVFSGFLFSRLCYKRTVFLYGSVYIYFFPAYGVSI